MQVLPDERHKEFLFGASNTLENLITFCENSNAYLEDDNLDKPLDIEKLREISILLKRIARGRINVEFMN